MCRFRELHIKLGVLQMISDVSHFAKPYAEYIHTLCLYSACGSALLYSFFLKITFSHCIIIATMLLDHN